MHGMLRNSSGFMPTVNKRKQREQQLIEDRKHAKHREIFFAEFLINK